MDDDAARLITLGELLGLLPYECAPDGRLQRVSPRLAALVGRPVLGEPLHALSVADEAARVRAAHEGATASGLIEVEWRLATPGDPIPVRDRAVRLAGGARVGALEEVGGRRREALLAAEAARAEGVADLAAGVAHEVNNALSGVLNYAQLAQRCAPGSPQHQESLDGVVAEARRILERSRALLTYARRADAAGPVPVADLVRAALAPVRRQLREELIGVELEVAAEVPPVLARGHELQTVLHYALGWVRRAAAALPPRTRTTLALRARHELDPDPGRVVLDVEHPGAAEADELERRRCVELLGAVGGELALRPGRATLTLPVA